MASSVETLRALLVAHAGAAAGTLTLAPAVASGREERYVARGPEVSLDIRLYPPSERDIARREDAGLRLAGAVGLAPALIYGGEDAHWPGSFVLIVQEPRGERLGARPLSDAELESWLFLLLTLHHLRPDPATQPLSMSADLSAWWNVLQPTWESCRIAYAGQKYAQLMLAMSQLHAITQVRIETNRSLWRDIVLRPCHGSPSPERLVADSGRLNLTDWSAFGLGDPAIEVAHVSVQAALTSQLSNEQYAHFLTAYLNGMRDLRDTTVEERLRLFSSVAPMGFAIEALAALSRAGAASKDVHRTLLQRLDRALIWMQALGVDFGDPAKLLAPLA